MESRSLDFLKRLLATVSPSGYEDEAATSGPRKPERSPTKFDLTPKAMSSPSSTKAASPA
jgi:hypothetical protein